MDRRSLWSKAARSFRSPTGWWSRGYLPHLDQPGLQQFVTIRLADSLPASLRPFLEAESAHLSKGAETAESSPEEWLQRRRRLEHFLDAGHGGCTLRCQVVATMVAEAILHLIGIGHQVHAWVIMPNHLHILITVREGVTLSRVIVSFKGYTASRAHKLLKSRGPFWYPEHFDRYIRDQEHFQRAVSYIEMNPVRAGLVLTPQDWRFSSAGWGK